MGEEVQTPDLAISGIQHVPHNVDVSALCVKRDVVIPHMKRFPLLNAMYVWRTYSFGWLRSLGLLYGFDAQRSEDFEADSP